MILHSVPEHWTNPLSDLLSMLQQLNGPGALQPQFTSLLLEILTVLPEEVGLWPSTELLTQHNSSSWGLFIYWFSLVWIAYHFSLDWEIHQIFILLSWLEIKFLKFNWNIIALIENFNCFPQFQTLRLSHERRVAVRKELLSAAKDGRANILSNLLKYSNRRRI